MWRGRPCGTAAKRGWGWCWTRGVRIGGELAAPFRFGIYPFAVVGMANGMARGAPDELPRLPGIIRELRGNHPLLLRTYIPYFGEESLPTAMAILQMLTASREQWEVVLMFRFDGDDLAGWLNLIRTIITQYGSHARLAANHRRTESARHARFRRWFATAHVRRALREGILMAKSTAIACGATVSIGFNAVPTIEGADDFWPAVHAFGESFAGALDYVGLDFYPDVFGPAIPREHLPAAVESILRQFRNHDLVTGGLPQSVPIRITENGWPTGKDRSPARQSEALETIVRTVHRLRNELNITDYELFNLRDVDSSQDVSFYQFGIMTDAYVPKPAFDVYRRLIDELSE